METGNKVTVKIFGQEYTIVGDSSSRQIEEVAAYVDEQMRIVSGGSLGAPLGPLAVLTAVNIAETLFRMQQETAQLKENNQHFKQEAEKSAQLWEETKRNFIQYREQAQASAEEGAAIKQQLESAKEENEALRQQAEAAAKDLETLQKKYANLMERLDSQEEAGETGKAELKKLEEKCHEIESNFFDLQMENIQLKGELDRYKKIVETE